MTQQRNISYWIPALLILLLPLFFTSPALAGWPSLKTGTVAGKGLVKGENGKPVWVKYKADGSVDEEIGEAHGDRLENAFVMSAAAYQAFSASFRSVIADHNGQMRTVYRNEYMATQFVDANGFPVAKPVLNPDTFSVVVRTRESLFPGLDLVCHESPLDLNRIEEIPDSAAVVLLGNDRRVLDSSANSIGFKVAFYSSGGTDNDRNMVGYDRSGDTLWAPISGARVETALGRYPTGTDENGYYVAGYDIPFCPGFFMDYQNNIFVWLRFQDFNPKSKSNASGSWVEWRPGYDYCNGYGLWEYGQTPWALGSMSLSTQDTSQAPGRQNFHIDVAMLAGMAELRNDARPGVAIDPSLSGVVPVGDTTEYAYARPEIEILNARDTDFNGDGKPDTIRIEDDGTVMIWLEGADPATDPPADDFNRDGKPDTVSLGSDGTVQIWYSGADPQTDPPDAVYILDLASDDSDQGLLKSITDDDLVDTSLYVYRVATDQRIGVQQGLDPNTSLPFAGIDAVDEAQSRINYRMLIRGPSSFYGPYRRNIESWQSDMQADPAFYSSGADHLRVGEDVRVVMINRKTGYIGTGVGSVGSSTGLLSFTAGTIALRPPNLKIRAERFSEVSDGLTAGETRANLIGFEGSGLTTDHYIRVVTEWYDWDGTPLPNDLPGYTGRLAKVVAENTLQADGQIANFEIKPGRHTQIVKLPQEDIDTAHFYIHVSGQPMEGNPDFCAIGAGEGPLQYRPKHYVPVKVSLYDEESSLAALSAYKEAVEKGAENLAEPKSIYKWVYRPEMQFSLLDKEIIEDPDRDHDEQDLEDTCNIILPEYGVAAQLPNLTYLLSQGEFDPLEPFAYDRQLIFSMGDEEVLATINGPERKINFTQLLDLGAMDPEDFIVMKLYQNQDDPNALWEYGIVVVDAITIREDGHVPVSRGQTVVAQAHTQPRGRDVVWSVVKRAERVKAEIDETSGAIKINEESGDGWVIIRAADRQMSNCYKDALVFVGCSACVECELVGNGFVEIGSVDARFSLGKAPRGDSAGDIFLMADRLGPDLYTPKALRLYTLSQDTKAVYDSTGALRQAVAPESFVDIVALDEFSFDIHFYKPEDRGDIDGSVYTLMPGSQPFATWRISNPDASVNINTRVLVTQYKNSSEINSYEYQLDKGANTWSLKKGGGLQITTRSTIIESAANNRIVTETISDQAGTVASKMQTTWHTFAWGEEIIQTVNDPDNVALTSVEEYYMDDSDPGSYGRIKSVVSPDSSWVYYHYDWDGRNEEVVRGWLDEAINPDSGRQILYSYDPNMASGDADLMEDRSRPRTVTEQVHGTVVAKTYYVFGKTHVDERMEIEERCASVQAAFGDSGNQRTTRIYNPTGTGAAGAGRIHRATYADGRMEVYTYEYGAYQTGDPGAFTPGEGKAIRETVDHFTVDAPSGISGKTTREISVEDAFGRTVLSETYVYTGNGFERLTWSANYLDDNGRVIRVKQSDGTYTESEWDCCGKTLDVDARGVETRYAYDDLHRVQSQEREGLSGEVITTFQYDAAGRVERTTVQAGGLILSTSSAFDLTGARTSTTDAAGLTTTYSQTDGGRIQTVTHPGGVTEISEQYPDGRTKQITGAGVVPRYYTYGVNADGTQWTRVATGAAWEKTTTDLLGRAILMEKPGPDGVEVTRNYYDTAGRLVRTTQTGLADTLYAYDALGNQTRSGMDADGNGTLDPASTDRITETDTFYEKNSDNWWQKSGQQVYATAGSDAATTVSTQLTQVTGLGNGKIAESVSIDIHGNRTESRMMVDRAAGRETNILDYPDSDMDAVSVSTYGLLTTSISKTGIRMTYAYDPLGRRTGITDPRTGTAITHYDARGWVDWVEDAAGHRTAFAYDPATGRKISETNAMGKVTRFAYNAQGQVTRTWGDAAYPVKYDYDTYGRMEKMRTYRSDAGFDSDIFPESATGDETAWQYDDATGLLNAKVYADGSQVSYTYEAGSRLATRVWARTQGGIPLVTSYGYDPDTGELLLIDYSDETPDITLAYDRLGRQSNITDAFGTRSFAYNQALQLESETMAGLYDTVLTRQYETAGVRGRNTGFVLDSGYSAVYGYDAVGRFKALSWNVGGSAGSTTYAYVPNSDLIGSLATDTGQITTYSYEPNRNLKTTVENAFNAVVISRYDNRYDAIGRRTSVANAGSAFAQNAFNAYNYNDRSELTESARYQGTDPADLTTPVSDEYRAYTYDPIGNRTGSTVAGESGTYTSNELNQYTGQAVPGDNTNSFTYDDDGNLTSVTNLDGTTRYTYNAENRLVTVEPETPADGATKVEFIYDYMGRRVQKTVYAYATDHWSRITDHLFVYDGWNMIEEITDDESIETSKYFVWGLDLSLSLQGAGGVGGLLATVDGSLTYQFMYDGNGNVGQMVNSENSYLAAHYEYDPFGKMAKQSGVYADENAYRFSTKYYDAEINLYYYGYRYYSIQSGRWLSRDTVSENGGFNLYVFVKNNSVNIYDYLGMWGADIHRDATIGWARISGMSEIASRLVGKYDNDVDGRFSGTGPFPVDEVGDQSYHFNMNGFGGEDTRIIHFNRHFQNAKKECTYYGPGLLNAIFLNNDDPINAARELGKALHPLQDWVAHGDFGSRRQLNNRIWIPHNMYSPQSGLNSREERYNIVDNPGFDSFGDFGRPSGRAIRYREIPILGVIDFAIFTHGNHRINKTMQMTIDNLNEFIGHVKKYSDPCGKCYYFYIVGVETE